MLIYDWPIATLAAILAALAGMLFFSGYLFRQARIEWRINNFLEDMAHPKITPVAGFLAFLEDFKFWDGRKFDLTGKIGRGRASERTVAKIIARFLVECPYSRHEVVAGMIDYYFSRQTSLTRRQERIEAMLDLILGNINKETGRGIRIWHSFCQLIELGILDQYQLEMPTAEAEMEVSPVYAKTFRLAKKALCPRERPVATAMTKVAAQLPAKADTSIDNQFL